MGKTLEEIEQMPERSLQEYQLFYKEQPFGLWREDYRTAQIAYLLAAVNSDPKKSPPKMDDFMSLWQGKQDDEIDDDGIDDFLAKRAKN